MNFKKIIFLIVLATGFPTAALAHGHLWYDKNAHVAQFGKLVIYPVLQDGKYRISNDVDTEIYKETDYLNTRFIRKLKVKTTIPLGGMLEENKKIREKDNGEYQKLLAQFPSEEERAAAVDAMTGAPGYFVPQIRDVHTEPHQSPETWVNVEMRSWTEEKDGPKGNRTYNNKTWKENHRIPAKNLCLYHMDVAHTLYNRKGEKILTYENNEHSYNYNSKNYHEKMFKSLVDEFKDDYKDIQKEYREDKENPREKSHVHISFKDVLLPENVGNDEYLTKSVYFTMKNYALKYTKASIDFDNKESRPVNYYVEGKISRYTLDRTWHPPYASTSTKLVSSKESKWRDRNGNEHKMKTNQYETKISDHYGYWGYTATVAASFNLVDARTGRVVVNHTAIETDDKCADAYCHFMKDFYKKVEKCLGE